MSHSATGPDPRRQLVRLVVLALVVGLAAAAGAAVFTAVEHEIQHFLWHSLPEALGDDQPPGWLVVVLLVVGALLVRLAFLMPGHGGHSPLDGMGFDITAASIASVLLAALASLSFGAVLGPEAPLLAIGTAIAFSVARSAAPGEPQILAMCGAAAGMGTIFGNPLITGILILEALLLSGKLASPEAAMRMLLPVLVALGAGFTLDVGIGSWAGLADLQLSVPGLPEYAAVQWVDVALAIPVSIATAALIAGAYTAAGLLRGLSHGRELAVLLIGALLVSAAALIVRGTTGEPVDAVLFSGQASIPGLLAVGSLGTVLVVLLGKWVAYSASMGSGFRGGAIFPAVYLGVGVAAAAQFLAPSGNMAALVAAGAAAATAGVLRMPFTAVLLGLLLTISAGGAVTVTAIVGAVFGLVTGLAITGRPDGERPEGAG